MSLEAIAKTVSDPLESNPVRQSSPNEDQYSYHHAKLFSDCCNLLVSKKSKDNGRDVVYVVRPDLGQILKIHQEESSLQTNVKPRLDRVWSFPDFNAFGPYPVTLVPVDNTDYFLVSNGKGTRNGWGYKVSPVYQAMPWLKLNSKTEDLLSKLS